MLDPVYTLSLDSRQKKELSDKGYTTIVNLNTTKRRHFKVTEDIDFVHSKALSLRKAASAKKLTPGSFAGVIGVTKGVDPQSTVQESSSLVQEPIYIGKARVKRRNPIYLWFMYSLPTIELIRKRPG